jgi:tRNA threonylcarbamoyladenosine biosynthesis protein TsaE
MTTPVATFTSISPEETREFARELAGFLLPGDLLLLEGDLGAGKTTFVQGLASGFGVTEPVASPTFTLMRIYESSDPQGQGIERLLHADLYRLEHLQEVVDLGLLELVEDAAVAVVEWGDAGAAVLGEEYLEVRIERPGDTENLRSMTLTGTPGWSTRVHALAALTKESA